MDRVLTPIYSVNVERIMRNFRLGVKDLMEIWKTVLLPETSSRLESMERLPDEAFSFPPDLWVQTIYEFAVAHYKGLIHREHLLKSMIPLYLGRVASSVKENQGSSPHEVEENIESLCKVFEEMKP